jgi:hypothetical protein
MKLGNLTSQHQRLSWLIAQANGLPAEQIELRAHWARYICVLSSGFFLENSLKEVYSCYARSCSAPAVGDYVEAQLERVQNPKASRFVETAQTFNKQWANDLTVFLDEDGRKEAIDAIMANRHQIAHGKDSGITLARVSDYLAKSVRVVEFIESQCGVK